MKHLKNESLSPPTKKSKLRGWLIYLVILIAAWLLCEYIAFRFGFQFWDWLPKVVAPVWAVISVLASGMLSYFCDKNKISFSRPDGMSFWEHASSLGGALFKKYISHNTLAGIGVLIAIVLTVPAYAAKKHTFEHMFEAITTPSYTEAAELPEKVAGVEGQADIFRTHGSNASFNNFTAVLENNSRMTFYDEVLCSDDALGALNLSDLEYDKIFFQTEEYLILDWNSEKDITSVVRVFVEDMRGHALAPNFAEAETPQNVKDRIALASELESQISTLEELERVISMRTDIFEIDPGYPLAKLLRENYCYYGNICQGQRETEDIAVAMYGRSVLWGFLVIEFDVEVDEFYSALKVIEERYEKIANSTPLDSVEHLYAEKLQYAFNEVAKEVFRKS